MGKRSRVCVLSSGHRATDTRVFHRQAKSLAGAGYDVTLVAQHDGDETVGGVRIVALPKAANRFRRLLGTVRILKLALRERADVYHFHDPELLPAGLGLKLLTGARVIYDVHEDYPELVLAERWLPGPFRAAAAHVFGFVEKRLARRLDFLIAATDHIACRFGSGRIATVRNYPVLEQMRAGKARNSVEQRLVYAGRLAEERGIGEMVGALHYVGAHGDVRLTLCGRFSSPSYERRVRRLEGFRHVDYLGWLPPETVWLSLIESSVGLVCLHPLPRYVVSLPIKLFEYMAAGIPVVASDFPGWREIVEGNHCGLTVNPLDPRSIAEKVDYLLEHPAEARRMGENGRRAVERQYNWESESAGLLAVYEELAG